MWPFLIITYLGFAAVLQGGLNRQISTDWGLPPTVLANAVVLLVCAGIVFLATLSAAPESLLAHRQFLANLSLRQLLPGLLGFSIVFLIPYTIAQYGALNVFLGLIAAQLFASGLWDYWFEGQGLNIYRLTGAGLAGLGAWIALRGSA